MGRRSHAKAAVDPELDSAARRGRALLHKELARLEAIEDRALSSAEIARLECIARALAAWSWLPKGEPEPEARHDGSAFSRAGNGLGGVGEGGHGG
jgi:hypothetical protein